MFDDFDVVQWFLTNSLVPFWRKDGPYCTRSLTTAMWTKYSNLFSCTVVQCICKQVETPKVGFFLEIGRVCRCISKKRHPVGGAGICVEITYIDIDIV